MAGILDLLYGGGGGAGVGGGGPMSLTPQFATPYGQPASAAAPAGPGAGGGMLAGGLDNPLLAAALGLGGGLMSSADQGGTLGQGLRAGAGGALGSYIGARNLMTQREEEQERQRQMQQLIDRLGAVAGRAGGGIMSPGAGGGPGGGAGPGILSSYGGLI